MVVGDDIEEVLDSSQRVFVPSLLILGCKAIHLSRTADMSALS